MRDFRTIIEVFKEHIANGSNTKVYDKDVANLLNISQSKFATIKKRNSTPFVEILEYCHQKDLCCSEIFFDSNISSFPL
ncbi:hypothetical protein [Sulfurimonas sp. NWX367]|uniref:hypothetical protein n=1 Tax=Sulfurimonas sp. NWX367 TaxID=2925413 RepID=UPI0032048C23